MRKILLVYYTILLLMTQLLAILNLSPDSFSDGAKQNLDPAWSCNKAKEFLEQGADFIDIGAESTRPGALLLDQETELARIVPFLDNWSSLQASRDILSLDSRNPKTIKQVFGNYGKHFGLLNDVTGLQNPDLLRVISEVIDPHIKLISMHSQGGIPPSIKATEVADDFYEQGLLEDLKRFWDKAISLCDNFGINHQRLILDPGLGFGKNLKHSLEIIELIPELKREFGLPILIGASRKSFLRQWHPPSLCYDATQPGKDLDELTREYNELCIGQGVDYLRVHRVL